MKPGAASSGRICESPKISLPLPHHCGTPGVFPGCPVKGFGSSAGVPGSLSFAVFVRMLSEITRHLLGIYSAFTRKLLGNYSGGSWQRIDNEDIKEMSCDFHDATPPKGQKWCYFRRKTTKRRRDRAEVFVALEPVLTPFVEVFQRARAKAFSLKRENEIHQALNELDVLLQALRLQ